MPERYRAIFIPFDGEPQTIATGWEEWQCLDEAREWLNARGYPATWSGGVIDSYDIGRTIIVEDRRDVE